MNENFFDFSVSIIYAGTRNFILTIKGEYYYKGFSIIITNKGMLVHSDADINSTSEAQILRDQFLKNYKDPYLCLLYTSPSPRDATLSRMPSSA